MNWLVFVCLVVASGCAGNVIFDQEGRAFRIRCTGEQAHIAGLRSSVDGSSLRYLTTNEGAVSGWVRGYTEPGDQYGGDFSQLLDTFDNIVASSRGRPIAAGGRIYILDESEEGQARAVDENVSVPYSLTASGDSIQIGQTRHRVIGAFDGCG
jgi:hypothetical protein